MSELVRVWWLKGEPAVSLDERRRWLLPEEILRADRYTHLGAQERYITGRWMLRSLLARHLGVPRDELSFMMGAHGKPEIEGNPVYFNLSHTDAMMVVALAEGALVGVDVECVERDTNLERVGRRSFSDLEFDQFLCAADPREAFFSFWTHKEAYLKARGTGISLGLKRFSFVLADDYSVEDAVLDAVDDDPARWTFARYVLGRHRVAVAVRGESELELVRFS